MKTPVNRARRLRLILSRLWAETRGVSFIEFGLVLPVLLTLGLFGTEIAYMAVVNMQVSQIATAVADNASRLGQTDNSSVTPTVTEAQIDSVMIGAVREGAAFDFEQNGRVILSSLERDPSSGGQYIHWQRCRGAYDKRSEYGSQGAFVASMGNNSLRAGQNSAVMFVEVWFDYHPLFGSMFMEHQTFHREAAFIIRDDRNLTPGVTGGNGGSRCV